MNHLGTFLFKKKWIGDLKGLIAKRGIGLELKEMVGMRGLYKEML